MKKLLLATFAFLSIAGKSQLTITDSLTTTQIESLLTGMGVTISGLTVNCHPAAVGQFSGTSEIPISNGLLLSTGYVDHLAYPASTMAATDLMMPGDSTIWNYLYTTTGSPYSAFDGCAIEFDCVPVGDTLMFNFAFGSEEYPEYVLSGFNDAFGIFMSGPGITGEVNVAALPTGDIVSVDNVNASINPTYYIDNSTGVNVTFDGFTTNLQVFAVVAPGSTYHFNVAISDIMDGVLDSGVMLEAFSFKSPFTTAVETNYINNLIQLYPNPVNNQFTIRSNETIKNIRVADYAGKIITTQSNINSTQLTVDAMNLNAGVYFVQIETENGIVIEKFSKIN